MHFCRDSEASIDKGESAEQLVKEVELTDHQEALKRAQQSGMAVVDEVATELRMACDEGSSKKKYAHKSNGKSSREQTFFYPIKDQEPFCSSDEYLEGSLSGSFKEKSHRLMAGSFAHATSQLVGERNFMNVSWVENENKKGQIMPSKSSVSRRRSNVTRAALLDGRDEGHIIKPSTMSILSRPIKRKLLKPPLIDSKCEADLK